MTEAKHTPGPHEVLGTVNLGGSGEFAFTVIGRRVFDNETQMTAYVNLPRDVPLYTAAPDMLEALQAIIGWNDEPTGEADERAQLDRALTLARAAIAKATGAA